MGRPIVMSTAVSRAPRFGGYEYFASLPVTSARVDRPRVPGSRTGPRASTNDDDASLATDTTIEPVTASDVVSPAPHQARAWAKMECELCHEQCWVTHDLARCNACLKDPGRIRECGICFSTCVPIRLDSHNCSHDGDDARFCRACVTSHCTIQLEEGARNATCPAPGCAKILSEDELGRASRTLKTLLYSNRLKHGREALASFFEQDEQLLSWASGNAQCCPFCYHLCQRSTGCNHMRCLCGNQFCYVCGGPWPCGKGCAGDEAPRFSFCAELLERKRVRRLAFRLGLHPRLGAESLVRVLPIEIVGKIEALM